MSGGANTPPLPCAPGLLLPASMPSAILTKYRRSEAEIPLESVMGEEKERLPGDRAFFGHPAGLLTLFSTEMWERFSYYGMRALLTLFMTAATVEGGLGFDKPKAGVIYALYTSLAYFAGIVGGWLADNMIGQRRATFYGGVIIMLGHICLAFHSTALFFSGLGLVIVGTGLLKPNISTMVGLLYDKHDERRDSGFALYYMGVNLGSFLGQTVCGFLAQHPWFKANVLAPYGFTPTDSWHWGFAAAAVGMFFGLIVFVWKGNLLGSAGLHANPPANAAEARRRYRIVLGGIAVLAVGALLFWLFGRDVSPQALNIGFGAILLAATVLSFARILYFSDLDLAERRRIYVVFILFVVSVVFWMAFEQAGGSLNLFADEKSQLEVGGFAIPSSWYQNVNPFGIIILSPVFAYVWLKWGRRAPSSPAKFAFSALVIGISFIVAALGSQLFDSTHERISPLWLVSIYVMHTIAELCMSPIGLSMVTKLSPQRVVSQVMSIWFLANANANFLAGQTLVLSEVFTDTQMYLGIAAITLVAGLFLAIMIRPIRSMMGDVH